MSNETVNNQLFSSIKQLIEQSKQQVAVSVNATMSLLYWNIGKKINDEILKNNRAEYGKQIVVSLARQLEMEYGRGWSEKQLRHCLRFAETFPDELIVSALRRQLSWTHIKAITYIKDPLKREFYIEMSELENWSSRQLQERIQSMLYERTAISKKPEETIKNELRQLKETQQISPDLVFRDPYFLDFLGLKDTYSEKDLRKDWEKIFEDHFCHQLDIKWGYKICRDSEITVDKENCIHWDRLEQFWNDTQKDTFKAVKSELGYGWKQELGKRFLKN